MVVCLMCSGPGELAVKISEKVTDRAKIYGSQVAAASIQGHYLNGTGTTADFQKFRDSLWPAVSTSHTSVACECANRYPTSPWHHNPCVVPPPLSLAPRSLYGSLILRHICSAALAVDIFAGFRRDKAYFDYSTDETRGNGFHSSSSTKKGCSAYNISQRDLKNYQNISSYCFVVHRADPNDGSLKSFHSVSGGPYDPTIRPWYKAGENKSTWTPVYTCKSPTS